MALTHFILDHHNSLQCWWRETSTKPFKTPQSISRCGSYLHTVIPSHQELATADAAMESGLLPCLVQPADGWNQGQHVMMMMDPSPPWCSLLLWRERLTFIQRSQQLSACLSGSTLPSQAFQQVLEEPLWAKQQALWRSRTHKENWTCCRVLPNLPCGSGEGNFSFPGLCRIEARCRGQ